MTGRRKYEDVDCPRCGARAGQRCFFLSNRLYRVELAHAARRRASADGKAA